MFLPTEVVPTSPASAAPLLHWERFAVQAADLAACSLHRQDGRDGCVDVKDF